MNNVDGLIENFHRVKVTSLWCFASSNIVAGFPGQFFNLLGGYVPAEFKCGPFYTVWFN